MTALATETTEHANGNGSSDLQPRKAKQVDVIRVTDDSQFANLLDTGKFEHLWRVAQMFASSSIIPQHFQNKPADCFVACQMAIRLGVDPFMFLQKTYVTNGKPGMEGQMAIALINTSGLFAGPIDYELGGDGDDWGCVAFATFKATGKQLTGPRVTIQTAKDEGWYSRNPKWKNIPEMMLRYRAGAWFGRLYCPERLMGMQTMDELEDIGVRQVESTSRTVGSLSERLGAQAEQARSNTPQSTEAPTIEQPAAVKVSETKAAESKPAAAKTETAPEPAKPAGNGAAPSPAEATKIGLVEALMNNQNCDAAKAEKKLTSFAKTLCQGRTLDTLTPDDVKALHKHIAAGDIVVPK